MNTVCPGSPLNSRVGRSNFLGNKENCNSSSSFRCYLDSSIIELKYDWDAEVINKTMINRDGSPAASNWSTHRYVQYICCHSNSYSKVSAFSGWFRRWCMIPKSLAEWVFDHLLLNYWEKAPADVESIQLSPVRSQSQSDLLSIREPWAAVPMPSDQWESWKIINSSSRSHLRRCSRSTISWYLWWLPRNLWWPLIMNHLFWIQIRTIDSQTAWHMPEEELPWASGSCRSIVWRFTVPRCPYWSCWNS